MSKGNKKQRHKEKRNAKRRESKRRESVSPVKRLANAPGQIECWLSDDFEGREQAQIFVYKQAAGLTGIACFLLDRGVVGLKDAWVRMKISPKEFHDMVDTCVRKGISMSRGTVDDVRRLVAGGMRWAHENGMRLPTDWEKPASLFGGVGDWMSADVSPFVKEFAGHPEDLRQRLIGEPFDAYLQRTDIHFIFSEDAPYMDQDTGDYIHPDGLDLDDLDDDDDDIDPGDIDPDDIQALAESMAADMPEEELDAMAQQFNPAATLLAEETIAWLAARGDAPSPKLIEAWQSIMLSLMLARAAMPDASEDELSEFSFELLEDMAGQNKKAVDQALDYLENNSLAMQKAILKTGLAALPGKIAD